MNDDSINFPTTHPPSCSTSTSQQYTYDTGRYSTYPQQQQEEQQQVQTSLSTANNGILEQSPAFRLLRSDAQCKAWLLSPHAPSAPSTTTTAQSSVAKQFQCHIPSPTSSSTSNGERRQRTLLYSPCMTLNNGVTLGYCLGSRFEEGQVWGLGWDLVPPTCCKFVYDENLEESLTFIWNDKLKEVAIVWVRGISSWEMKRELFVFEYFGESMEELEGELGKRQKVWMRLVQRRECEVCGGVGIEGCRCSSSSGRRREVCGIGERKLLTSPVDITSFDVKSLDGVFRCTCDANIYNPDTLELLSRRSVTFTTEVVSTDLDTKQVVKKEAVGVAMGVGVGNTEGMDCGAAMFGIDSKPISEETRQAAQGGDPSMMMTSGADEKKPISERLMQHLQKCADDDKANNDLTGSPGEVSTCSESMSMSMSGELYPGIKQEQFPQNAPTEAQLTKQQQKKKNSDNRNQPIKLVDMVNLLCRLQKEDDHAELTDSAAKRRKKRGPYRKRGEIDKATRDHERKLKNRELAHAANQKKRERTKAMELELKILKKAVRSILGYTRELEDVNSILANVVSQSSAEVTVDGNTWQAQNAKVQDMSSDSAPRYQDFGHDFMQDGSGALGA